MENENITAIILSSGKQHKIQNKPVIVMKEEITIRTLLNLIGLFCSEIIISANCGIDYRFSSEKVVFDEVKGLGTIGTIISCLKKSSTEKNLVVSCDMPLIPAGLIRQLLLKKDDAEFIVPSSGKITIEPFCAIYDKSVIEALNNMIAVGDNNIFNLPHYCVTSFVQVYNGNNIFRNKNVLIDRR